MRELYYTPLDLAVILKSMDLTPQEQGRIMDFVWEKERAFIDPNYRERKSLLYQKVMYWYYYLLDKAAIDAEFPMVQRDVWLAQGTLDKNDYLSDFSELDTFFKSIRIRLLYNEKRKYVRIKLSSLLKQYGYQRRSPKLMEYISRCLLFYHLQPYLRGEEKCNLSVISRDAIVIFREVF